MAFKVVWHALFMHFSMVMQTLDSLLKPRSTSSLESKCSVSFWHVKHVSWLADGPWSKLLQSIFSKLNAYLHTAGCCNTLKYVLVARLIVDFVCTWVMLKIVTLIANFTFKYTAVNSKWVKLGKLCSMKLSSTLMHLDAAEGFGTF